MASTTKNAARMAGPRPGCSAVSLALVIVTLPLPELRQGPDSQALGRPARRTPAPPGSGGHPACPYGMSGAGWSAPVPCGLALVDVLAGEPIPAPVVARVVAVRRPVE